jgi:hypothetical protein
MFIVKPDGGSLGQGITILNPNDTWVPQLGLAIAQEYIDSKLISNTKFDMRIYALVSQIQPLRIYVYREGIARFCSQQVGSEGIFSQITNTAVNRQNPHVLMSAITRRVSSVFEELNGEGADIDSLWKKIDKAIVLTIIAAHNFIQRASHNECPSYGLPRCFQLLGFDVLIDRSLEPYILEVNYRPSLEYDTEDERQLKVEMLAAVMTIAAPFSKLQSVISSRTLAWNDKTWSSYLQHNPDAIAGAKRLRKDAVHRSKFVRVFPKKNAPENQDYERVLSAVKTLPVTMAPNYRLPEEMESPAKRRLAMHSAVKIKIMKPKKRGQSPPRKKMKVLTLD